MSVASEKSGTVVRPPPEKRFLQNVCSLMQLTREIIQQAQRDGVAVPVDPTIVEMAEMFVIQIDPRSVINTFIMRSFNHWQEVEKRNVAFFKETTRTLFQGVSEENIVKFLALYDTIKPDGTRLIDAGYEKQFFEFFEAMIKQAICYIHQERKLDPVTKKYTVSAYPEIKGVKVSVKDLVAQWKVTQLN